MFDFIMFVVLGGFGLMFIIRSRKICEQRYQQVKKFNESGWVPNFLKMDPEKFRSDRQLWMFRIGGAIFIILGIYSLLVGFR